MSGAVRHGGEGALEHWSGPALAVAVAVLAVVLSVTHLADYDVWWHAALGRDVVQAASPWPAEVHSYTSQGTQTHGEWLADVLIYLALNLGGPAGANGLKAALVLGLCLALFGWLRARAGGTGRWWASAAVSVVLVLLAIRFRLYVRPYLFTYLGIAVFLWGLESLRRGGPRSWAWILVVAQLVWANTSKGAFFGPLLVVVFLVDSWVHRRWDRRLVLVLLGVSAASLCNPDGPSFYLDLFSNVLAGPEASTGFSVVGEHQPLSPELLWGFGLRYLWAYQVLALVAAVGLFWTSAWRRPRDVLPFLGFLVASVLVVRFAGMFSVVATGLAFDALFAASGLARSRLGTRWSGPVRGALFVGVLLLAGWSTTSDTYAFGNGVKAHTFPEEALTFLEREGVQGRVFNSYSIGGYILWRAPERRVFIDGRAYQAYPPEVMQRYEMLLDDSEAWAAAAAELGFTVAVLEYDLRSGGRHFPLHLTENPEWALVHWDAHSAVFVRRLAEFQSLVERRAYRLARPALNDFTYLVPASLDRAEMKRIDGALVWDGALNPENQEPLLARAYFLLRFGSPAGHRVARQILEQTVTMDPDLAMEHSALATLLLRAGERDRARKEALRALELDPYDAAAGALRSDLDLGPAPSPGLPTGHP